MLYPFGKMLRKQKRKEYTGIPEEVMKELTSGLPIGYSYKNVDNKILILKQDESSDKSLEIHIKNFESIDVPDRLKNGKLQDLLTYANNTQKEIRIKCKNSKENDIDIYIEKEKIILAYSSKTGAKLPCCEIVLQPNKFKKKRVVLSTRDGANYPIDIIQVKSESEYIFTYESIDDKVFNFKITLNTKEKKADLSVSIKLYGKYKIDDVIKYLKLQKSMLDMTVKINDLPLCYVDDSSCDTETLSFLDKKIKWWENINKINKELDCEMEIDFPISMEMETNLFKLYVGLVLKEMFKENINAITDMRCKIDKDFDKRELIKDKIPLALLSPVDLSVYGIDKNVYLISYLNNINVKDVTKLNKNDVILKCESKDAYCVYKYEVSEDVARENVKKHINNAKFLREFSIEKY